MCNLSSIYIFSDKNVWITIELRQKAMSHNFCVEGIYCHTSVMGTVQWIDRPMDVSNSTSVLLIFRSILYFIQKTYNNVSHYSYQQFPQIKPNNRNDNRRPSLMCDSDIWNTPVMQSIFVHLFEYFPYTTKLSSLNMHRLEKLTLNNARSDFRHSYNKKEEIMGLVSSRSRFETCLMIPTNG